MMILVRIYQPGTHLFPTWVNFEGSTIVFFGHLWQSHPPNVQYLQSKPRFNNIVFQWIYTCFWSPVSWGIWSGPRRVLCVNFCVNQRGDAAGTTEEPKRGFEVWASGLFGAPWGALFGTSQRYPVPEKADKTNPQRVSICFNCMFLIFWRIWRMG